MIELPRWYEQLRWSEPRPMWSLDPETIPRGAGIYTFSSDPLPLRPQNALYIDGARQHLRSRLGVYARRFRAVAGRPSRHRGLERLNEYFRANPHDLYVRWAGLIVAREIEGSLIDLFDPRFNNKDEHRYGFADDELIPDDLLY